jgi:hypothetical protein
MENCKMEFFSFKLKRKKYLNFAYLLVYIKKDITFAN